MKKFAPLCALLLAALFVFPAAACGEETAPPEENEEETFEFNLDDYAIDVADYEKAAGLPKGVSELHEFGASTLDTVFKGPTVKTDRIIERVDETSEFTDKTSLFDLATGKSLGKAFSSGNVMENAAFLYAAARSDGTYAVYSAAGDVVLENLSEPPTDGEPVEKMMNGTIHKFYPLSYRIKGEGPWTEPTDTPAEKVYFTYEPAEYYGEPVLTTYPVEKIETDDTPKAGDTVDLNDTRSPITTMFTTKLAPTLKSPLDGYEVSSVKGNNGTYYTFYKDGAACGTFGCPEDAQTLGIFGSSVYYYLSDPVDPYAQSGYNVVTNSGKFMVTYYRYDVAANELTQVDFGYYIDKAPYNFAPLYNFRTETVDLTVATDAYPFINGVANTSSSQKCTIVFNSDGKKVRDLSYRPFTFGLDETGYGNDIIKLKEDRYLVWNSLQGNRAYIVNGELDIVSSFYLRGVYPQAGGLVFSRSYSGGLRGIVDYDGKLVLPEEYQDIQFYGDKALLDTGTGVTTSKIISVDDPEGVTLAELLGMFGSDSIAYGPGLILCYGTDQGVTVFNYNGTSLTRLEGISSYNSIKAETVYSYKGHSVMRICDRYYYAS